MSTSRSAPSATDDARPVVSSAQREGPLWRLRARLRDAYALDPRSLALGRIAIALVLLADLVIRACDLRAHYTDAGVLPLEPLLDQWLSGWRWSLHGVAGSAAFEAALFVVAGAAALGLLLGWRTRWVTVAAWLLTVSLQNRNPLVLTGADSLLRALVLWGCFLPWGDRWSLDARRAHRAHRPGPLDDTPVASFGTFAWTGQVILVHSMAGLLKTGDEWRKTFTAVYYTLQIDQFQLPLGAWLLRLPDRALRLATAEVMLAELLVPLLLLSGLVTRRFRDRLRSAAVIVLALLHLGLAATLALGLFPWVNLASLVVFLPAGFHAWCARRLRSHRDAVDSQVAAVAASSDRSGGPAGAPAPAAAQLVCGTLGAMLFVVVVWGNLRTLPGGRDLPSPPPLRAVMQALRLDQRWNLFAPKPMTDDGWFVVPGALESGELVDVFRGGAPLRIAELEQTKPADVSSELGGYRWRKYLQNLRLERNTRHRALYAAYLCRDWNASHPGAQRATAVQLLYLRERTPPPGGIAKVERVPLGHFECSRERSSRRGS